MKVNNLKEKAGMTDSYGVQKQENPKEEKEKDMTREGKWKEGCKKEM